MRVSVIIPALNEAGNLRRCVASIGELCEVIIADGGSDDNTGEVAKSLGAKFISCKRGRGEQMDTAAKTAKGDVLLFLHADTTLPPDWLTAVKNALGDEHAVGGAFRLAIDSKKPSLRLIAAFARLRSRLLGLTYGDQAIFALKKAFMESGGFNKLPLMEDVDCVKRLKTKGRFVLLNERVTTSPRRWEERGAIATTVKNIRLLALYLAGAKPETLYKLYYRR